MSQYKFFYGDGEVAVTKALAVTHLNLFQRLVDWKKLPKGNLPQDYAAGYYSPETGEVQTVWRGGNPPDDDSLRFLLRDYIDAYVPERYPYYGASIEDTEPTNNLGFLEDPHDTLYPCAWEGEKMKAECKQALKSHVLNAIQGPGQEAHADQWIYFTVYGSGASYNWNEEGDFDVQMWLDIAKYNEHHPDQPKEAEELLKEIRRDVQRVNFPSFEDLGLDTEDCDGKMLIQFYPKIGTGDRDENLSQKPYACYDIENDDWYVKPKPITPEFYGEHFVIVMDRAHDIADQSQQLIDQFQRNVLTWQFFTKLYSQTQNKLFLSTAQKAQIDATEEQQGIAKLFQGVFGDRIKAYSPEGKGIEDEGDETQKLLEVWGVFQELKHWARAPLPWDKQDMPAEPIDENSKDVVSAVKVGVQYDPTYWKEQGLPKGDTFGYIDGHLILSKNHHKAILGSLITNGWTWEELMNAPQAWGWFYVTGGDAPWVQVSFSSDSGYQNEDEVVRAKGAFAQLYHLNVKQSSGTATGVESEGEYGTGLGKQKPKPGYESETLWDDNIPLPPSQRQASLLKLGVPWERNYYREHNLPEEGCYGFVNGTLILGIKHHQAIMMKMINAGWTWEQLMSVPQVWGWFGVDRYGKERDDEDDEWWPTLGISFASDSGIMTDEEVMKRAAGAFANLYHMPIEYHTHAGHGVNLEKHEYGKGLRGKDFAQNYLPGGQLHYLMEEIGKIPPPPEDDYSTPESKVDLMNKLKPSPMNAEIPTPGFSGEEKPLKPSQTSWGPKVEVSAKAFLDNLTEDDLASPNVRAYLNEYLTSNFKLMPTNKQALIDHLLPKLVPGGGIPPPKNIEPQVGVYSLPGGSTTLHVTDISDMGVKAYWDYGNNHTAPTNITKDVLTKWIANGGVVKQSGVQKFADWNSIMEKAQKIRQNGGVQIQSNQPDHVTGIVQSGSDPANQGPYNTEIWRDDPNSQAITMWDCDCPWDDYSWGRTRQWKKYEGRPCAHTLALFWEAQTKPPQQTNAPPQTPPTPAPGGDMMWGQGLIQPVGQPPLPNVPLIQAPGIQPPIQPQQEPVPMGPTAPPAVSRPTTDKDGEGRAVHIPGSLSHWKEAADTGSQFKYGWTPNGLQVWQVTPGTGDPHHFEVLGAGHEKYPSGRVYYYGPGNIVHHVWGNRGTEYQRAKAAQAVQMWSLQNFNEPISDTKEVSDEGLNFKNAAFQNGNIVKTKYEVKGIEPQSGLPWVVPQQSAGEVLYSDDTITVAIFPLTSGPLGPHLVKVQAPTEDFYSDEAAQPFIKRHSAAWKLLVADTPYAGEAEPGEEDSYLWLAAPEKQLVAVCSGRENHVDLYGWLDDQGYDTSDFYIGGYVWDKSQGVALEEWNGSQAPPEATQAIQEWLQPKAYTAAWAEYADVDPGWTTRPENWGPMKIDQLSEPYDFKMPPEILQRYLDVMECPHCHSNLLKDEHGIYCPTCTWNPSVVPN